MPKIAKVVVEIALDREFDYQVPEALEPTVLFVPMCCARTAASWPWARA